MTPNDDDAKHLKKRIEAYETQHHKPPLPNDLEPLVEAQRGISFAISIIVELIVPVAVGIIGHQLDIWVGQKALFVFIFILLGLGVAFIQIKRLAEGKDDVASFRRARPIKKKTPQDHG